MTPEDNDVKHLPVILVCEQLCVHTATGYHWDNNYTYVRPTHVGPVNPSTTGIYTGKRLNKIFCSNYTYCRLTL